MEIIHSRVQHGVGQGSFHSASIEVRQCNWPGAIFRYDYVYDCGALVRGSPSAALLRSIKRLDLVPRRGEGARAVIDAVVLSHYDQDHIIGAQFLAAKFKVKRIIVPHLAPMELMLVLACQPTLHAEHISELHRLATGGGDGTLFGVPVTQVQPGPGPDAGPEGDDPDRPFPPDGFLDSDKARRADLPASLVAVEEGAGAALGGNLPAGRAMRLKVPHGSEWSPWRFKFWNRGVSDRLMEELFLALWACDFPMHALDDAGAVGELVDWLADAGNREAVLFAYEHAIEAYKTDWAKEAEGKRLANFLSLGMYSGPAFKDAKHVWLDRTASHGYIEPSDWWRWHHVRDEDRRSGWLGTGDAPLGESDVWDDFSRHYQQELGRVLTVQVPHHGAAPKTGPKFFNPGLLPEPGMCAVISAGTYNTYGHPTPQVIKEVLATEAHLVIVTEESWLGLHEVLRYQLR